MKILTLWLLVPLLFVLSAISVRGQVAAGFSASPTAGCPPLVVSFTNTTTPAAGTTYSWNLGNGTGVITLPNPGTSYLATGTYTVTLTATNAGHTSAHSQVITVYPTPVVHFTADDTAICPGVPVTFTNSATGGVPGPLSYLWSSGDGYSSTGSSFIHAYSFPGYFNITLNVTNADGCATSLTQSAYVHVFTPPVAAFYASQAHFCHPPGNTVFTSTPSGVAPFTYQWTFGDGSPHSAASAPAHTYSLPGFYSVGLTVADARGCEDSNTVANYIDVAHLSAFFSGPDSACPGVRVTFLNTSTPYISNSWTFGDGDTSTADIGYNVYSVPGTYTVTHIIYDGFCYDTVTHPIIITPHPAPFTITPARPCPVPSTASFSDLLPSSSYVLWKYGDGDTGIGNPATHTYTTNKFDTVQMFVTSHIGCKDSSTQIYKIYDMILDILPGPSFSTPIDHTKGCIPFAVNFTATSQTSLPPPGPLRPYPYSITSYLWNFADGSPTSAVATPSHVFTAVGVYPVKVTITTENGCTFTQVDTIRAGTPPSATFTATPRHACYNNNEIQFTRTLLSGPMNGAFWLFGEGPVIAGTNDTNTIVGHHFVFPGIFSDTLIALYNGCPDTFIRANYITIDSPQAIGFAHVLCSPINTVQFGDSSIGENTHLWIFANGATSTLTNPRHTYPSSTLYTALLTDYNTASGCRDTALIDLNLTRPVVAISTPDTAACRNTFLTFSSAVTGGTPSYYEWFAPGSISADYTQPAFTDTFHLPGRYTIQLVIEDQNSCFDTATRVNYILIAKPVSNFTASPAVVCWPSGTTYSDASTDVTGTFFTSFTWRFGDGQTAVGTSRVMEHTYTTSGTYTVTEITTDNIGCKDSLSQALVSVYEPVATFSAGDTIPCSYRNVYFTATSTPVVSYTWSFGDGGTSPLPNPVHDFVDTGYFSPRLVVTDAHGCSDTASRSDYIHVTKPHASFYMDDSIATCSPLTVHFTNTSAGAVRYNWTLSDSTSSVARNPVNLYVAPGFYTVTLVATNLGGCMDTTVGHIKIFGYAGAFRYGPDSGCAPRSVFFDAGIINDSSISSIIWDFADGTTSAPSLQDTITHIYAVPGAYIPKLIISDRTGCANSSLGVDTIKIDHIIPGFKTTPNPVCVGNPILLIDTSVSLWSAASRWNWSYNGTTDTLPAPYVTYTASGTYTVSLLVTDGWGCVATATKSVSVYALPHISISPDSVICTGATTTLADSGGGVWNSSNPAVATIGTSTGRVTGVSAGRVALTYTLAPGCIATATVTVDAYPNPGPITGASALCAGDSIILSDTLAGGVWAVSNPSETLIMVLPVSCIVTGTSSGIDTISYTAANGSCVARVTKLITIHPLPTPGAIQGQDPICKGAVTQLKENVPGGAWLSGDTAIATIDSATGTVKGIAVGTITVTYLVAPDSNGCRNKATFPFTVIPGDFTISRAISNTKCYGDSDGSIVVTIVGGSPPFQYTWSTGSTAPAVSGLDTGAYFIKVEEAATQCILSDTFHIATPDSLQVMAEIKSDACLAASGSISITASGGTPPYNYRWSNNATATSLTGLTAGTYTLLLADGNNCIKTVPFIVADSACPPIIIHDAISPNGDGINDTWVIERIQYYPKNQVKVFDKWGDQIFEATNYKNDWGGAGKNGMAPDGTYYYLIKLNAADPANENNTFTGFLMIKR